MKPYEATEILFAPQWDSQVLQGPCDFDLFQVPMGQSGKDSTDTSMYLPGMLPPPNTFKMTGVRCAFFPGWPGRVKPIEWPNVRADLMAVMSHGELELRVANRTYLRRAPLASSPARFASFDWYESLESLKKANEMPVEPDPQFSPLIISAAQHFCVHISLPKLPRLSMPGKLFVWIDGELIRQLQ